MRFSARPQHNVILGIDPRCVARVWIIRVASRSPELLAQGTVKCAASLTTIQCLARNRADVARYHPGLRPTVCVVEGLFFAQNLQTALIMGEARGGEPGRSRRGWAGGF
jgi:Holliday junction resolvasome RuvABC endonuclease subunit